jgi:hypothetical protein
VEEAGTIFCEVCFSLVFGPIAQRLEQGIHNLVFRPRRQSLLSPEREHSRPFATLSGHHPVNMASTEAASRRSQRKCRQHSGTLGSGTIDYFGHQKRHAGYFIGGNPRPLAFAKTFPRQSALVPHDSPSRGAENGIATRARAGGNDRALLPFPEARQKMTKIKP